jgi:hypothetical protein
MIPLKKPNLRRYFNFLAHATYDKYVSFLENFAPCTCLPQAGLGLFERNHIRIFTVQSSDELIEEVQDAESYRS